MADAGTAPSRPRRPRRSGAEVRRLILDAAHALFIERGYDGATTKEIATAAGVGESVVFRNFGSKPALFEASMIESFTAVVGEWVESWEHSSPEDVTDEVIAEAFVGSLLDMALEHRDLIGTLVAARRLGADPQLAAVADNVAQAFSQSATAIRYVLLGQGSARRFDGLDHPVTVAAASGMIISMALLDGWFFPLDEGRPDRGRVVHELTQLLLHGVAHRAPSA